MLSPGLEPDALDGDVVDREVEIVHGTHDDGVDAASEDLRAERIWRLDKKSAPTG